MIARARAVAHGSAYTTYATLKRDAEFVCCENMAGDMTAAVTDDDLDNIWLQFKYAGENYIAKGKAVSRNLIAMEVSPTKDESKGWTLEQWKWFAHRFIEEMDKIEFRDKNGKVSSKRMDLTHSIANGKEPEHFTFDVSENLVDTMCSSFKALEDEFEFAFEEVIETSLFVFFELMSVPGGSGYSSGSCGGSNNDLPHKKKDDDDELLRAMRIAKAVARSCPRKVIRHGYGR